MNTISGLQGIYDAKVNVENSDFYSTFSRFFKVLASATIIGRAYHTIRYQITTQVFAMSAVSDMEGVILDNIGEFCRQLIDGNDLSP